MEVQNFLDLYRQGQREFAHVDLSGASLSGANLRDIDLTGANLTGANLSWASLNHAKLTGACLRQADLRSVNFNGANLNQALLSRAKLAKADLRLATLQEAELNWAILEQADLSGADLYRAKLDQINLNSAKLNNTQLIEAELMEAHAVGASLIGANLTGANLRESHLEKTNLREAILVSANFTEANLSNAYLRAANLSQAYLHRANLTGADLSEANLNEADLSRAILTGAYLLKASLRKAYLLRAILSGVYLLRADLTEANLRGADLRQADLSGAYLRDATLNDANLSDAYLLETHLIRTNIDDAKMTGCCINNWHIEDVDFSKVECRYVFNNFNYSTKKPDERYPADRDFQSGELGGKYQEAIATIELFFKEAPNWEVLVFTLTQVETESPDLRLAIKSYEAGSEQYLLRLSASHLINRNILSQRILQVYPEMLERFRFHRQAIMSLLQLSPHLGYTEDLPDIPQPQLDDKQQQNYQEIVNQIQRLVLSQAPNQLADSVQRLLDYLNNQAISITEIQQKILPQAIFNRSKQDEAFRTQLMRWQETTHQANRLSIVGEAMDKAIALLKE